MVLNYSNTHETLTLMSGIVTFSINFPPLAYKCGPTTVFLSSVLCPYLSLLEDFL